MKERGQLAYEAFRRSRLDIEPAHLTWGSLKNDTAAEYAAVERAVRDATLEEAAQLTEVYQRDAQDPWEWPGGIAKDIRALIEEPEQCQPTS